MRFSLILLLVILFLVSVGFWRYHQPLPALKGEVIDLNLPTTQPINLTWPAYGQAAIGAVGFGVLATNNAEQPVPIASIAKIVTALAVLEQKPLVPGQPGELITLTEADVQLYRDYLAKQGSVLPVKAGDQITQHQALIAMLVPSANNLADTVARWAFGSMDNYVAYANQMVEWLGMFQTHIADASGFSPSTTSTAKDLVVLGDAALAHPLIADIVKHSETRFPGIDQPLKNFNWLLGTDGVIGIKTGNTDQAKGCFLFAAKRQIEGLPITVVGAVLGADTRDKAVTDAQGLIRAADSGFQKVTVVKTGQTVARYKIPWGDTVETVAASDLTVLNWRGNQVITKTELDDLKAPKAQKTTLGSFKTNYKEAKPVSLKLKQPVAEPSWTWRLVR